MTLPSPETLLAVIDATWPTAATTTIGPATIRQGQGGGSRVSAATATSPVRAEERLAAEQAMRDLGQPALFMIRPGDEQLDADLAAAGYQIKDETLLFAGPIAPLTETPPPPITCFEVWPPLACQTKIWAEGGIGPARLAVMDRATTPKTTVLGRTNDRPAATAYVGLAHQCAMIHALEVSARDRRKGLAAHVTRAAAIWGAREGALWLTLVTTKANKAAQALYTSMGLTVVGQYHYRIKPDA